jgi:hypothetical protein
MALIDNMGDVAFASAYPIDKIIEESPRYSVAVPAGDPVVPTTVVSDVAHTAGASTVVNGMYSIDGSNFYPFGAFITGPFTGGSNEYMYATAWNNASTVYLLFESGYTIDQTVHFYYVMESLA